MLNVDSLAQFPVLRIASIEIPAAKAFEADAPLVECAEKTDVSIPAAAREERIHPLTVFDVMLRCGLLHETKRELIFEWFLCGAVASTYALIVSTGQQPGSRNEGIKIDCSGPLCWAFLGFSSVKLTPLEEKVTD